MTPARAVARRAVWICLPSALVLLCLIVAGEATAGTQESREELSAEQRTQLEQKARELNKQGEERFDQGRYAEATTLAEQALQIRQRLYPREKYPQGHVDIAENLGNLGVFHLVQGKTRKAEPFIREALAMYQVLYPKDKYPLGHPNLANTLNTLGGLLLAQGEHRKAEPILREALAMFQALYPKDKYLRGHPALANVLNTLGGLLQEQGEFHKAEPFMREALAMHRAFFPKDKFPLGHPALANLLNNLGYVVKEQGEYGKAEAILREGLAMRQTLYPKEQYPHGHPDLANSLNTLGDLLRTEGDYLKAERVFREALAMYRALYPRDKYPQGHPHFATTLQNLAAVIKEQGEYAKGEPDFREALAMYRALYPRDRYPLGHPDLSHSLNSLGSFLHAQGESGKAEPFFREALAMRRAIYSKDRYPLGHPYLAFSLNNWGGFLHAQGEYSKAESFMREALAMRQALYPKDKYRLGHPELATSMHNLGIVLARQGKYDTAEHFFRDALAMYRALHPREKNPLGHPDVANALNSVGGLLQDRGEYPKAASFMREALAMYQAVFPKDKYPFGHKNLALSYNNLGMVLLRWGKPGDAEPFLREALTMYQGLVNCRTDTASEAEGLNYIATLPLFRDYFLSATRQLPPDPAAYDLIWKSKAALGRILHRRHLDRLALRDPDSRQLAQDLQSARRELARLLLQPLPDTDRQKKRLQQLTEEKEQLERSLAQRLRDTLPLPGPDQAPPARLRARLPAHAVFIDLLHYWTFEQDPKVAGTKGERQTRSYVAFVVRPGQPVQRVELGEAEPIDQVLKQWRREIAAWRPDRRNDRSPGLDQRLSQLVWQPLVKYIPPDTETVYLSPDGDLSALPWAALPGRDKGTVLLEEHALALVPHGPFLLERLEAKPLPITDTDVLLTLGGVRYDRPPESIVGPPSQELIAGDHTRGGSRVFWGYLPGTERELKHVRACAGPLQVLERTGTAASTTQLLADLPRARFAHLATHGFFDGRGTRSILQLTEEDFRRGRFGERIGVGARNPLYLSGLVLAGANRKDKDRPETYAPDGGILTAEELVSLPLEKLELVVLSACETGLGDVAAGEGVLGLQRAFHIAGARNVVASLWQVDDEATAALMALFYHCLWLEKQAPLQALRTAQLTLYRHPELIPPLARARGPKPDVVVKLPRTPLRGDRQDRQASTAGVKQWAGFVLSGTGR